MSTRAPDISFSATLTVRCRGEVLASGGISFSSSSVKLRIGEKVSGDKEAMDALSCSGVIFSETYKWVMASISCF